MGVIEILLALSWVRITMDKPTADVLEQMRQAGIFMPGTLPPTAMGFPHPSTLQCIGPFCMSPL